MCSFSRALGAAAVVACASSPVFSQGYDAIGADASETNTNFWIQSATNSDTPNDVATCAGVGSILIPAGKRINLARVVLGQAGPGGSDQVNFGAISGWSVGFWTSTTTLQASPTVGDVLSINFSAPTKIEPWGTDYRLQPAYRATFRMPGGLNVQSGTQYLFAVRATLSLSNVGQVGPLESSAPGQTGYFTSPSFGIQPMTFFPPHKYNGVLAYQFVVGCPGDHNGDGAVSVQDIFDFLSDWFAGKPGANFNGASGVTVQDIFDFLSAWFAPCT